jgi:hypothetical protein
MVAEWKNEESCSQRAADVSNDEGRFFKGDFFVMAVWKWQYQKAGRDSDGGVIISI